MNSTDPTQQQINDAASQIDPNLSASTPPSEPPAAGPPSEPASPPPEPPPVIKEEAILPPPLSPEPPSIPDVPPMQESSTTTFGPPPPSENAPTPPPAKKGVSKGFVLAIVFLLLATLPVAIYYVSQQQQQLTENRSRASGVPEGQSSGCCSSSSQCAIWFGAGSTCDNLNGACSSGKQCRGGANTTGGNCHQCTQTDCNVAGCGGQTCNAGCVSPCGDGICGQGETYLTCPKDCKPPSPSPTLSGTICSGSCCSANTTTALGLYVQRCTCSGPLVNGRCLEKCENAGGYACIPDNFCGSMQLDIRNAKGEAAQTDSGGKNLTQIAKNGNGQCAPPPPPPIAANPPPPPPLAGQCTRIRVYKDGVPVNPTSLKTGDNCVLAVAGANATKGRIRVNGAAFVESTTLNANGEYTVPFTIPSGVPSFTIEAEVFTNGQWQ